MDLGLAGKVAIVGGASQGIGYAIARALAAEGVRLGLVARRAEQLEAAAEMIRRECAIEIEIVVGNVSSAEDNVRAITQTVQRFGRLDILVNNDGAPRVGAALDFDDASWDHAVQQNLMSVVRLCRLAVPHMRAAGGGRIVNIASTSVKQPPAGLALSVSTWAGVIAFSKSLVRELGAAGITVNTICPGFIRTPRLQRASERQALTEKRAVDDVMSERIKNVPIGRLGTPEDVAGLVVFLASARGSFITGTTIQVDGGMTQGLL